MPEALIGLGSNLGERRQLIETALARVAEEPSTRWLAVSTLRETAPVGGPPQGQYLNGAGLLSTELTPEALLAQLLEVERSLGRERRERNGPRPIDLDLLLFEDVRLAGSELELPHPRMLQRGFVLEPLAEIAGPWIHPATGRSLAEHFEEWRCREARPAFVVPSPRGLRVERDARAFQRAAAAYRRDGLSTGFVPTLGGLHRGHLRLVEEARQECDRVLASIYLNPTQFDSPADLETYPAVEERDLEALRGAGVDLVLLGQPADLLPEGFQTWVELERLPSALCGPHRPGHFRGVSTVVTQLLHLAWPERAYFGAKDYQQSKIIERLVGDLCFDTEIRRIATVREDDGLALSSRNARLTPWERERAPTLFRTLLTIANEVRRGQRDVGQLAAAATARLEAEGLRAEYVELLDAETLEAFPGARLPESGEVLIAAAAWLGEVRLIDNLRAETWSPSSPGFVPSVEEAE